MTVSGFNLCPAYLAGTFASARGRWLFCLTETQNNLVMDKCRSKYSRAEGRESQVAKKGGGSSGDRQRHLEEETARLRHELVDELIRRGFIDDKPVEKAFRKVPRHVFVAGIIDPRDAYLDEVIPLKLGMSTVSQPSVVAIMLKGLKLSPRLKVLEIGTASGYSAALLAELVGPEGKVYTIEIDPQLARQARKALDLAGYSAVEVIAGDGSLGLPARAPFDRIVITAAASRISPQLIEQLTVGGLLLTPFNLPGLPSLLLCLRKEASRGQEGAHLTGEFVGVPVCFVPLRGAYEGETYEEGNFGGVKTDGGASLARALAGLLRRRPWLPLDEQMGLGLMGVLKYRETAERIDGETILTAWEAEGCPGLGGFEVEVAPEVLRRKQAVDLGKLRIWARREGDPPGLAN